MAEVNSKMSSIWQTLAESDKISEQLANDFQDWIQEEEFNYEALVDDINDAEDQSTIAHWLRKQKYIKNNEFIEIRQLITSQKQPQNEEKYADENNPSNNTKHASSSIKLDINPSDLNYEDLLDALNKHLNLESNPSIVSELISQLEQYSKKASSWEPKSDINESSVPVMNRMLTAPEFEPAVKLSADDLQSVHSALTRMNKWGKNEIAEFVRFCTDEGYDEDLIIEDIAVFEEGDSAIIGNMTPIFSWDKERAQLFVTSLRNILGIFTKQVPKKKNSKQEAAIKSTSKSTPDGNESSESTKGAPVKTKPKHASAALFNSDPDFTPYDFSTLPEIHDFIVPLAEIPRTRPHPWEHMETCFKFNGISENIIGLFEGFLMEQADDTLTDDILQFNALSHGVLWKQEQPELGILIQYIEKCQDEMLPAEFKGESFSKQTERAYAEYIDEQCPGVIKHDRDLLKYFVFCKQAEPDLSTMLIDTLDRLSVSSDHVMDVNAYTNKKFFEHLSNKSRSILKSGLRTYHNRFFARLNFTPMNEICDKISDYQKYACTVSAFVKKAIDTKIIIPPMLIDFMIIPPGIYCSQNDAFSAVKVLGVGDIKQHLDDFDNDSYSVLNGLTAKDTNFDEKVMENIVDDLCKATKKLMDTLPDKKHQRMVIVVDRRWRVMNNKHTLYNKLRCSHSQNKTQKKDMLDKEAYDYEEYEKDIGRMNGDVHKRGTFHLQDDDDDDDDDDDGGLLGGYGNVIDFKQYDFITRNTKNDTIYLYQPKAEWRGYKFNEFQPNFCHQTLMYLTKRCILPRKATRVSEYSGSQMYGGYNSYREENKDEYKHLSGSAPDGWMWNLSIHIYEPPQKIWYKYRIKWYLFTQAASIRMHQLDLTKFWTKYFVDVEKDIHKMSGREIKKYFKFDLDEVDVAFKRWYTAISANL